MPIASMDFDLIVATPMRDSVMANKMLRDYLVMIGYREMSIDLVLFDLQDFDVILGMDQLASYHASVYCFGKMVTFQIPSVDLYFLCVSSLDGKTCFYCENLIFKKFQLSLILFIFKR